MLEGILIGVAAVLISTPLIWLGKRIWSGFNMQKAEVRIDLDTVSYGPGDEPGLLERKWKVYLKFYNKTGFMVGNFKLLPTSHRYANNLPFPTSLEGFTEHISILPILERLADQVHPQRRFVPDMTINFSYDNDKGKTFYTRCVFKDGKPVCEFPKKLP